MDAKHAWFAPKANGYGSSWPIAWQGWAVLAAFLVLVAAAGALLRGYARPLAFILLTGGFCWICALKTEGGWRWRP